MPWRVDVAAAHRAVAGTHGNKQRRCIGNWMQRELKCLATVDGLGERFAGSAQRLE
eukprot:gene12332-3716_t